MFVVLGAVLTACQSSSAPTPQATVSHAATTPSMEPATPPPSGSTVPARPSRVFAVGDMASDNDRDERVVNMIESHDPDALLALGDLVYPDGTIENYSAFYATSYGTFDGIVWPTPGNHDYVEDDLSGYRAYFGTHAPHVPDAPYYEFELGGWHLFALNSEIGEGEAGSDQYAWLEERLEGRDEACVAAYWHSPVYTIGRKPFDEDGMLELLELLMEHDVDLVLTGHDHNYQRWELDGLAYFVVGTGGRSRYDLERTDDRVMAATDDENGALELVLEPGGAAFRYFTMRDEIFDRGSITC
ncbi:MAG: metallophosphoesterase [Chloroflexi bacterium]|nr:metallophosphoesterase [Chloroflexota bacterium]